MAQKRRKFSPQYKAEAVAFVLETGRPITEVAADLGINAGTLGNILTTEWKGKSCEHIATRLL